MSEMYVSLNCPCPTTEAVAETKSVLARCGDELVGDDPLNPLRFTPSNDPTMTRASLVIPLPSTNAREGADVGTAHSVMVSGSGTLLHIRHIAPPLGLTNAHLAVPLPSPLISLSLAAAPTTAASLPSTASLLVLLASGALFRIILPIPSVYASGSTSFLSATALDPSFAAAFVQAEDAVDTLGDSCADVRDTQGQPNATAMTALDPAALRGFDDPRVQAALAAARPGAPASPALVGLSDGSLWVVVLPPRGARLAPYGTKVQTDSLLGKMFGLLSTPFRSQESAPAVLAVAALAAADPFPDATDKVLVLTSDLVVAVWSLTSRSELARCDLAAWTDAPLALADAGLLASVKLAARPWGEAAMGLAVFVPRISSGADEEPTVVSLGPELFLLRVGHAADTEMGDEPGLTFEGPDVAGMFVRDPEVADAVVIDLLPDFNADADADADAAVHVLVAPAASASVDPHQVWTFSLDGHPGVHSGSAAVNLNSLDALVAPEPGDDLPVDRMAKLFENQVFAPGQFPRSVLVPAIQAYHGARLTALDSGSPAVIRQTAVNVIAAHATAAAASDADAPAEAYAHALAGGWISLLEHCMRLARTEGAPVGLASGRAVSHGLSSGLVVLTASGGLCLVSKVAPAAVRAFPLHTLPDTNTASLAGPDLDLNILFGVLDGIDAQLGPRSLLVFVQALTASRSPLTASIPDVGLLTESEKAGPFVRNFILQWKTLANPVAALSSALESIVGASAALGASLTGLANLDCAQLGGSLRAQALRYTAQSTLASLRSLLLTQYLVAQLRDDSGCVSAGLEVILTKCVPDTESALMRALVAVSVAASGSDVAALSVDADARLVSLDAGAWLVQDLLAGGRTVSARKTLRLLSAEPLLLDSASTREQVSKLDGDVHLAAGDYVKARDAYKRVGGDAAFCARIMQRFDECYQSDLASEFAYAGLAALEGDSSRGGAELCAILWSNVFKHACSQRDFDSAYLALVSNPDVERRGDCLRRFVVLLCEAAEGVRLCEFPFVGLADEVEACLLRKGRSGFPYYYEVLYAWHMFRSNFRAGACVMYERGAMARNAHDALRGYLAASTALNLVDDASAWILQPRAWLTGPSGGSAEKRRRLDGGPVAAAPHPDGDMLVVSRAGVERELAMVRAWALLGSDARPESVDDAVAALALDGHVDEAFSLGLLWGVSLQPVFEVIIDKALAAEPGAPAHAVVPGWDLPLDEMWWSAGSLASALWALALDALASYDSERTGFVYSLVAAQKVLAFDRRIALPRRLIVSLVTTQDDHGVSVVRPANVAALARLYLAYGCVNDAKALVLEFLDTPLASVDDTPDAVFANWLPYQVIDEIALSGGQDAFRAAAASRFL